MKINLKVAREALLASTALSLMAAPAAIAQDATASENGATQENSGGFGTIVVTAQKREQNLQDVPVSITALDSTALAANRITSVRDLDAVAPNLTVRSIVGGAQLPIYQMRGVVGLGSNVGSDKGIGLYVDGVYIGNAPGSVFELGDIERIEVLRGPQGTLFGRNSTGGAVSIITPQPSGELGIRQTTTAGNYDHFKSATHIDTPQIGPFSASFNYVHTERDGDIRNLGAGTQWDFTAVGRGVLTSPETLGGHNTDAVSANVKMDLGRFKAIYRFDYSETELTARGTAPYFLSGPLFGGAIAGLQAVYDSQAPFGNTNPLSPITNRRPDAVNNAGAVPSETSTEGHSLTLEFEVSDSLSFKNIAAFRKSSFETPFSQIDGLGGLVLTPTALGQWLAFNGITNPADPRIGTYAAAIGQPILVQSSGTSGKDTQYSNEFQVNYDSDFLTATAGALYFRGNTTRGFIGDPTIALSQVRSGSYVIFPNFELPFAGQPKQSNAQDTFIRTVSKAVYGQVELHPTDNLDVIGGLRYTKDKRTGTDNSLVSGQLPAAFFATPVDYTNDRVTYNVGLNYRPADDILLFAKYSTGFISGGVSAGLTFEEETVESFEAGIKAEFLDRRARVNLSVYHADYSDLQLTVTGRAFCASPALAATCGAATAATSLVVNAGDARARGAELETVFMPIDALTLGVAVGFNDFKYKRLEPALTGGAFKVSVDQRPKWTGNVFAQYTTEPIMDDTRLVARIDGNYRSSFARSITVPGAAQGFTVADSERFDAANRSAPYWLWNTRVALEDIEIMGSRSTLALWGRNIFNNKSASYSVGLVYAAVANFETAPTYGVDWTIEF